MNDTTTKDASHLERKHPLARCEDCTLQERRYCPSYHPQDRGRLVQYSLVFIGRDPGDTECDTGEPFTGPAGKMHYSVCRQAGINKIQIPHMNICNCEPPMNPSTHRQRPHTPQEAECCFPRLKAEIHAYKPKLIIALGDEAMAALTGKKGIKKNRGYTHPLLTKYEYDCQVYCCLHPSFIRTQRQWIPLQVDNYTEAVAILTTGKTPTHKYEYILDPSAEELEQYLKDQNVIYGVDTETTGLDYLDDQIIGHSFAKDTNSAVSVVYSGVGDPRRQIVTTFLEDPNRKKCWQNGSFDTGILAGAWNVTDQGFEFDTRLAQQLLNSDLPSDLDFLRSQYTSIAPYKPPKASMKQMKSWSKQTLLQYAADDAITTLTVMQEQQKQLSDGQTSLMKTLLIPLVRCLNKMQLDGVAVSENNLLVLFTELQPMCEKLRQPFTDLGLNPNSSKQMKDYLGTPTGKDILNKLIKRGHPQSELMQTLIDYRMYSKLLSTYIVGIHKRLKHGRIHTHFKIEGTGTGRISSENPNLQNVPDFMRAIYVPDPDHIFVSGDHKQIELWVGAILAEEWDMLDDLRSGSDIHFTACKLCFPDVPIIHNDRKKDFDHRLELIAKTVVFGTFYGRSARSVALEFGVSEHEARQWQQALINKYPRLGNYKRACERAFHDKGYVETPFGRRRYLSSMTQGYNAPVQSTAADITLGSIVKSFEVGLRPCLTVHDDIVFQVPLDKYDEHVQLIKQVMERHVPELGTSFRIDYKEGYNWYEMQGI